MQTPKDANTKKKNAANKMLQSQKLEQKTYNQQKQLQTEYTSAANKMLQVSTNKKLQSKKGNDANIKNSWKNVTIKSCGKSRLHLTIYSFKNKLFSDARCKL